MAAFVKVRNKYYYEGSVLVSTERAMEAGICESGRLFLIAQIQWRKDGSFTAAIFSPDKLSRFHDMEGAAPDHQGYWLEPPQLGREFDLKEMRLTVVEDVDCKGKDLTGRKGKYLCPFDNTGNGVRFKKAGDMDHTHIFVEMDDYVGGSGCDGLGKRGHCVMVPRDSVQYEEPNEAQKLNL